MLTDRPSRGVAGPDTASVALWQAHVARAVRSGAPAAHRRCRVPAWRGATRARCAPRWWWRWSPRSAIAGDDAPSRLALAMEPTLPRETPPPATELQAWITPPAYTRLAPIFLKPDGGTVSVPAQARI